MHFRETALTFASLEAVTSRRRMVELTADLLRRAGERSAERVVYLLQGRLRPPYEGLEIGVGEQLLTATLAKAYHCSRATVSRRLERLGDLGLVAEALSSEPKGARLTVDQAFDALLEVAHTSGAGSVEGKISRMATLLGRADSVEARYLVRIAQGRLRLGVGDQTVLEAAALAALGDRAKKPLLEHAYNVRSALGAVVRLAFREGEPGLKSLVPEPGIPVRPALAQRLGSARAILDRLGKVQAEPKYDGFRLQLHRDGARVWAFSRRLDNVTEMFPDLVAAVRRELRVKRAILEGEALVHNPETDEFLPFQVTMTRKRKKEIGAAVERYPLRLFAFDLLYSGHASCLGWPQSRRSRELRQMVRGGADDPIVVTESEMIDSPVRLQAYFEEMIHRGLEGVVAKRPDAPYQAGARGFAWVKLKRAYQSRLRDTVDLVLVGYLRGRGKRAALGVGSLLAAVYDEPRDRFRTIAKIGSGLSEEGWRALRAELDRDACRVRPKEVDSLIVPDVWVTPRIVVEVLADEITRSPLHTCGKVGDHPGYALRFPRLLTRRTDKGPEDATTEREVLRLFRLERRKSATK
ncbi:MAG TPA: ATP-dependent DNA ligase [Gemmatimonadales bacterium]|nr:ATP-dependent DNA ligase [Gemmatimonadales bacterium]